MSDVVELKRIFPCSKRDLFEAWSKPSVMAKWFYAGAEMTRPSTVVNSFTVGGRYELTMHMPNADVVMHGVYRHINRYNEIHFTWNSHNAHDSLVELTFRELSPNRTELILRHSLFPSEESRAAHNSGWQRCFDRLEEMLAA
jgi:uncharacterized protein YndB with AHSA1/START domain